MLVSMFPYKKAQTAKDFALDAINVQFKTYADLSASTPSATAITALSKEGAKALAATAVAATAVLATL